MKVAYTKDSKSIASTLHNLLEEWGEVVLTTASGRVAEIHKGDDWQITDDYIWFIDNNGDEHIILFDQLEQITTHRASFEE